MLNIVTLLWNPNRHSQSFSRMYDESWALKLFAGFGRNLTIPFQKVLYVDGLRELPSDIWQIPLTSTRPSYADCIEPYQLNEPMILVGLDTVVVGNVDDLARYCLDRGALAYPRDPYHPKRACNGVSLVSAGWNRIFTEWRGENDMVWIRKFPHQYIDDLFPGQVVSYKGHVKEYGLGDARIVYFHGKEKPHELPKVNWIQRHWTV